METHLRLILLIVGIVIILGIVLETFFRKKAIQQQKKIKETVEPPVESDSDIHHSREEAAELKAQQYLSSATRKRKGMEEVIVIYILARQKRFLGQTLITAFKTMQLEFGEMNLFHRYDPQNKERTLFSVALAVEPGYFDLDNMQNFSTPGLALFMTVSEPVKSMLNFEHMLSTARQLAMKLEGDLKDSRRHPLTIQAIESCRERIRRNQYQAVLSEIK